MKNVILLTLSITLSIFLSQIAQAQVIAKDNLAAFVSVPSHKNIEAEKESRGLGIANPDAKLVLKLARLFPNAMSQKWWLIDDHYHVSFIQKEQKSRAVFTKEGRFSYALTNCTFEQLPTILQKRIGKEYPGYTLVQALEISAHNTVAHQVILECETGFITLKATLHNVEKVDAKQKVK